MFAKEITKAVAEFVEPFGIKNIKASDTFEFNCKEKYPQIKFNILPYGTFTGDEEMRNNLLNYYEVDIENYFFVFSLLHEVGHFFTMAQFLDPDNLAFDLFMRLGVCEMEEDNQLYFLLPAEKAANEWAIDYISDHLEQCWEFEIKCRNILNQLYDTRSFQKWQKKTLDKYEEK